MTNASRFAVAALGLGLWAGCQSPTATVDTSQAPLVANRAQATGTLGFDFLPPISWQLPPHFDGVFAPDLSPTVLIDQVQLPSGQTLANVATLTATDRKVRRHPWREFYIARFDTSGLDPKNHYRVRVMLDDKELGAADLGVAASASDLKAIDASKVTPVLAGMTLPIKFRIERKAADQDGDGVPDWRDNCPTIYTPPVAVPPLPGKPVTPARCDYNKSDCDPQELDCLPLRHLQQPDVCSCPGNGANCPVPDACHTAGMCDPTTGACALVALPDQTPCSDGNACNGAETCQGGVCTPGTPPTCGSGTNPCQAASCDPVDGCRTATVADGTRCPLPNGEGLCRDGACGAPTCANGFGDCDGDPSNGCERDLSADVANCGACGATCTPSCQTAVFTETWDSGAGAWRTVDGTPVVVTSDGSVCDQFQRETLSFAGGHVFTKAGIAVNAGAVYCLTAWIRGSTDASPFLGMQIANADGTVAGSEHWLIGMPGYSTSYPNDDTVAPVASTGDWAYYAKSFTIDSGVSDIVLKDENFGTGAADFDQIQLWAGACPAPPAAGCAAPTPACQAALCTGGACSSPKL
jgi:hypothetical protein